MLAKQQVVRGCELWYNLDTKLIAAIDVRREYFDWDRACRIDMFSLRRTHSNEKLQKLEPFFTVLQQHAGCEFSEGGVSSTACVARSRSIPTAG